MTFGIPDGKLNYPPQEQNSNKYLKILLEIKHNFKKYNHLSETICTRKWHFVWEIQHFPVEFNVKLLLELKRF